MSSPLGGSDTGHQSLDLSRTSERKCDIHYIVITSLQPLINYPRHSLWYILELEGSTDSAPQI